MGFFDSSSDSDAAPKPTLIQQLAGDKKFVRAEDLVDRRLRGDVARDQVHALDRRHLLQVDGDDAHALARGRRCGAAPCGMVRVNGPANMEISFTLKLSVSLARLVLMTPG